LPITRLNLDKITRKMRIKRESPCLGLRFMPIKLGEFIAPFDDIDDVPGGFEI
jgi:hypothetical protein